MRSQVRFLLAPPNFTWSEPSRLTPSRLVVVSWGPTGGPTGFAERVHVWPMHVRCALDQLSDRCPAESSRAAVARRGDDSTVVLGGRPNRRADGVLAIASNDPRAYRHLCRAELPVSFGLLGQPAESRQGAIVPKSEWR